MSLRAPSVPRLVPLAATLCVFDLAGSLATVSWGQPQAGSPFRLLAVWLALNSLVYLGPLAVLPFTARVLERVGGGPPRRWLALYGFLLLPSVFGCALRANLALHLEGTPIADPLVFIGPLPWVALIIHYLEREAAFRTPYQLERAALEAKIESLVVSRATLLALKSSTAADVLDALGRHVSPELARLERQLAELVERGELPSDEVLAKLQDDLDALGEGQVRRLGQGLHPSIVDLGLVPAIASLARRYRPRLHVEVEAQPPPGSPGKQLQLDAYRIVEAALEHLARQGETATVRLRVDLASPDRWSLELATDRPAFNPQQLAIIESRVGLAGGHWHAAPESLRVEIPVGVS